MLSLFGSKTILGLDIGSSSVKLIELESSSGGYRMTRFGYAPVPPEAIVQGSFMNASAISDAVREAYESGGFKSKDVSSSVSGHSVIVKQISPLPKRAIKLMSSGVTHSAAMQRSPSFSRSSSSTKMICFP